jgi:hypothetical protein
VIATAKLKKKGEVEINLAPAPFFAGRLKLSDSAIEVFKNWRMALLELKQPIIVDVALDLQELAKSEPQQIWQVTHRAVDYAFYAEAPTTSAIGEFAERFRALLAASQFDVGRDLIETMPGAIVELYQFKGQYKGSSAHHGQHGWKPDNKQKRSDRLLCNLLLELGVNPGNKNGAKLSSSDFDACVCALTALAYQEGQSLLDNNRLKEEITERVRRRSNIEEGEYDAPGAFSLLGQPFWESIKIVKSAG